MPIVTIDKKAGYDYAPLGRKLGHGQNPVADDELAILQANEQIRREIAHGLLVVEQERAEPAGGIEPPAPKRRKVRK